ncbi:hypothetical protein [Methylobacterium nodulans]|uniref:Tail assembly chaperone n=1 Tax=Methylobacterium nodulans (strain LMG 21967 / CNCM I-2342 / ORS 2060) TaxID=460265 RepID=B8ITN1_METNO|nr:hypothetical protein [Methylobacterium nodulans]ACL58947.1 hypothetical protein Mnod_4068 [Methylobacterium nodulans ORS 2060]
MKLKSFKTNSALLEQGRWVDDIPQAGNLRLRVRGLGNVDYRTLMDRLVDAVPREKRIRGIDPRERDRITGECLAEAVLLDWDNLFEDEEETVKVPFSKELAKQLLTDPDYVRLYDAVIWAANLVANESEQDQKDAEGK